jgi:hypothetical protein
MKKLLMIALALNLVACSTDSDENTSGQIVAAKENSFNSNPTPKDYKDAKYLSFMQDLAALKSSATAKNAAPMTVWVNTYVPDAAFRAKLISLGAATDPVPGDNYVTIDQSRGGLVLTGTPLISDLTGIKSFTSLVQLVVSYNSLTTLDVSGMTNLSWIECQNNAITSLNLTGTTNLSQLWCQNNQLATLTLPLAVNTLWGVWCYGNQLTTINFNGNNKITDLFCQTNKLTAITLTPFTLLKQVNFSTNKWVTLNFNSNTKLTSVWCFGNTLLTDLSIKNGFNSTIVNQDFRNNVKAPPIHVDAAFLPNANTSWPNRGSSTYVL